MVQYRFLLSFSLGDHFHSEVWCDVLPMTVCHLLIGRPWMYDQKVSYDRFVNIHSPVFKSKKLILEPLPIMGFSQKSAKILSPSQFQRTLLDSQVVYMLVCKAVAKGLKTVKESLLAAPQQFEDVFPEELPSQLPPPRDVQHAIPGSSLQICHIIVKITITYCFSIPWLDNMLDQLGSARVFSKLDL